ncbi:MAG: DUF2837 family protein [Armatimonadetes bacterium]|nr:DUF2837 family protein [Armatimonadota bacterium]
MPPDLLDPQLIFICALAAVVSLLATATVASRPSALITRRVALSVTIFQIFFMVARFANLFYLPVLGHYVDEAIASGRVDLLLFKIRIIVGGAAFGGLLAWLLLPTMVELFVRGIRSMESHKSMIRVLLRLFRPSSWRKALGSLRRPSFMGVSPWRLDGIPVGFLIFNVLAGAIWTVGVLSAMYVSAIHPEQATTAVLLSGLVNAFAAIAFSVLVDPKAALITDQALAGERPERHVAATAVWLAGGNFLGNLLGQAFLEPANRIIEHATLALGSGGGFLVGNLGLVVGINALVTLLASTTVVSRISAVITRRVATAIAIYNLFFLVTRLAQQIYAPVLGTIRDHAIRTGDSAGLAGKFQLIVLGATVGVVLGWMLMPTFVEVYKKAILGLDRLGSVPALLWETAMPRSWHALLSCIRRPSLYGVRFSHIAEIPRHFLWANVLVISIYTIGVMAATYASALEPGLARTAALLSSVVNGVATVALSLVVDPTSALLTDQAVAGQRPHRHIYIMAVFLTVGTLVGTCLSQLLLEPAARVILMGAHLIDLLFHTGG